MPRRQFIHAIKEAQDNAINHISNIQLGDGDIVTFDFSYRSDGTALETAFKLVPTKLDEYPLANGYILFTEDNDVDPHILSALEHLQSVIDKLDLSDALNTIASGLVQAATKGRATNPIDLDSDPVIAHNYATDTPHETDRDGGTTSSADEMEWDGSDIDSDDGFGFTDIVSQPAHKNKALPPKTSTVSLEKLKRDLSAAKREGFKIGVYGNFSGGMTICISIRVTKLGISEEAMQAWSLSRKHYLVLLIRFKHGYRTLSQYKTDRSPTDRVEMRVGLCDTYKPGIQEVGEAFSTPQEADGASQTTGPTIGMGSGKLEALFIGRPLNELLRDRFATIIQFRSLGLGWTAAEKLFNETQGSSQDITHAIENYKNSPETVQDRALPSIVMADSLGDASPDQASLPLVAMQFVLRHFVRCTEFCLACHCRTDDTFEALKPYVCSKPLCLYQFLSYGFGAPIEYEIISQPYVVDLLTCLCFSGAAAHRLRDMPLGINLKVPLLPEYAAMSPSWPNTPYKPTPGQKDTRGDLTVAASFTAKLQPRGESLLVDDSMEKKLNELRGGTWIATMAEDLVIRHFRVRNIVATKIYLESAIYIGNSPGNNLGINSGNNSGTEVVEENLEEVSVDCYLHDQDFDSFPKNYQNQAICAILRCLPPIDSLRKELIRQQDTRREASLDGIKSIPQSARDLLRWIIASNRSCIVQVDVLGDADSDPDKLIALEPRVSGMEDWIQFRFAQGAPDKEQRFIDAVKSHSADEHYPTLFAWHGSRLANWHSIIRQGLNYDEILTGRSFGNGVYMSSQLNTSLGYSGYGGGDSTWPGSKISATQVVSLQEVVNAPNAFVSSNPHFVVADNDWIQTRYLFVKTNARHSKKGAPEDLYEQEPCRRVLGQDHKPIDIPITVVAQSRRLKAAAGGSMESKMKKKLRIATGHRYDADDDSLSVATDVHDSRWADPTDNFDGVDLRSDIEMLESGDVLANVNNKPLTAPLSPSNGRKRGRDDIKYYLDQNKTDFVPGQLDTTSIKFLPPPSDASIAATRALMKAFTQVLETQETTPLHTLGFFIDPDRVENMYQWIIELHTFEASLPLAKEMKEAKLTSVVLEMLFTNDYPYSPPFVRVVRPRFLPFLQGGGGHVTEGGAICMELLTSSGWSAVSSIESILMQIKLAISDKERPARLLTQGGHKKGIFGRTVYDTSCYGIHEAVTAFKRACSKHGWTIPPGVDGLAAQF